MEQVKDIAAVSEHTSTDLPDEAVEVPAQSKKYGSYDTLEEWNSAFTEWAESHDATLPPL